MTCDHRFRSSDLRPKWRAGGRNWGRQRWSTFQVLRFQILWRWRGIWDRGSRAVRTLAGIPLLVKSTILHQHSKSTITHKMYTNEEKSTNWILAQPLKSARAQLHHLGTFEEFKSRQKGGDGLDWTSFPFFSLAMHVLALWQFVLSTLFVHVRSDLEPILWSMTSV